MAKARFGRLFATVGLGVIAILLTILVLGRSTVSIAHKEPAETLDTSALRANAASSAVVLQKADANPSHSLGVCGASWITGTIDSTDDVGGHTSIGLAPTYPYTPHISYHNLTSDTLKHAWLNDTIWLSETVDLHGGQWTSLALAPTHPYTPCVSYHDYNWGWQLRYACLGSTDWITMVVGRGRAGMSGTSLALEPTHPYTPHISYYYPINYAQHLGHAWLSGTAWHSGTWRAEAVERGQVGAWSSVALEPTYPYTPHISYYAWRPFYDLKHAWLSGTTWHSETVDSAGDVGRYTSLALDSRGTPHISYFDNTNGALKHAWLSGTIWLSETIDTIGTPPWGRGATSLKLDDADTIYISYHDAINGDLKLATFDGQTWITQTVDDTGNVGWFSSLALDPVGCPHISYYDQTNGDLKYAYIPTIYEPVQADFVAQPTLGIAPLRVVFTNTSTGAYTSSMWDFGDGTTSTLSNPSHTYKPGVYSVALTVSGPGGTDAEEKARYILARFGFYLPIVLNYFRQ